MFTRVRFRFASYIVSISLCLVVEGEGVMGGMREYRIPPPACSEQ